MRYSVGVFLEILVRRVSESRRGPLRLPILRRVNGSALRTKIVAKKIPRGSRGIFSYGNYSSTLNSTLFSPTFVRQFQRVTVSRWGHFASSATGIPFFGRGASSSVHSDRSNSIPVTNFGRVTCVALGRFGSSRYRVPPSGETISRYPPASAFSAASAGAQPGSSSVVTMREKISPAPVAPETPFMFDPSLFPLQTARR